MRLREPLGYFNGVGVSPMWGDQLQSGDQRVTGVVEHEQWYAPTLADLDAVQAVRDQTLADATFVHTQPLGQLRHTQARSQDGCILGGRPGQRRLRAVLARRELRQVDTSVAQERCLGLGHVRAAIDRCALGQHLRNAVHHESLELIEGEPETGSSEGGQIEMHERLRGNHTTLAPIVSIRDGRDDLEVEKL